MLDEDAERIEVVVPDEQLSLAIGRRGQNVRLASQLTGWDIDIMTEAEESERRQKEFAERTELFMEALDVDEMLAQLLASEGFATVEEVAYVDAERDRLDRGLRRGDGAKSCRTAPANISSAQRGRARRASARSWASRTSCKEIEGVTTADAGGARRGRRQDGRGSRRLRHRRSRRLDRAQGRRDRQAQGRLLDGLEISRDEAKTLIMQARVKAGWIEAPVEPEAGRGRSGEAEA